MSPSLHSHRRCYGLPVFDHVGIQVADVEASLAFYQAVFEPFGLVEAVRYPVSDSFVAGLSDGSGAAKFWLGPADGPETRELHIAFTAPDRATIEAVHEAALSAGAEILHAPKEWPIYHPGY